MKLKGRLKLIADMVPPCDILCDIGTDHGYIPIYLILNKKCKEAVASDIKEGPIAAATGNIKHYKLERSIKTRIGPGLSAILEGECEVIVIAGMGGELIKSILEEDFEKAMASKVLILQPMNSIEILRKWLYESGFDIVEEKMAKEGEKFYNVLAAKWTGNKKVLDEFYYLVGEKLILNEDRYLVQYIERKIKQIEVVLKNLGAASGEYQELKNKQISIKQNYETLLIKLKS